MSQPASDGGAQAAAAGANAGHWLDRVLGLAAAIILLGLVCLTVAVTPANVYMWLYPERFPSVPEVLLLLRLRPGRLPPGRGWPWGGFRPGYRPELGTPGI